MYEADGFCHVRSRSAKADGVAHVLRELMQARA